MSCSEMKMSSRDRSSIKSKPKTLANKDSGRKQAKTSSLQGKIYSRKTPNTSTKYNDNDANKNNSKQQAQENLKSLESQLDEKRDLIVGELTTTGIPSSSSGEKMLEQETDVDLEAKNESAELLFYESLRESAVDEISGNEKSNSAGKPSNNLDINLDASPLPEGWEQHSDKAGLYYWHITSGIIQRDRPVSSFMPRKDSLVIYHDDEEINQAQKTSSDDDDYVESGAALTIDDTSESTFVVYPLGSCEFDETQLISAVNSKSIQKCILRLSNKPTKEESFCWGIGQTEPILMRLLDDHIQFTDLNTHTLIRSQPIQTIKTWAVDDDNNFAFVIEERASQNLQSSTNYLESIEDALLSEPCLMCYVFRSMDDDDMSCRVAAKLNEEINRYKGQMFDRAIKNKRLQQMVEATSNTNQDDTDEVEEELEVSSETTLNVRYIGSTPVPRPVGIDILNVAIDKCLADASKNQIKNSSSEKVTNESVTPLIEAKLHVSPSSVIVENVITGEIIVECRIRYLTFMGISKRDIRWCGFIMQNATTKSFIVHCFECHPTAGHVCEAIQKSCTKMYEKVVKNARQPETLNIIPTRSRIRNTLVKTFSRIKLKPAI